MAVGQASNGTMFSRRQVEIISGLVAGFSTTIVMHPLDLIKIRLQLSPEINTKRFKSLIDVISKINTSATTDFHQYKQAHHSSGIKSAILGRYKLPHTVLQYYRGIGPNIGGNIVGWSLYFTLYAEFKRLIDFSSPTANYFTSSTAAGVTTGLLTNPIWVLKTRILGTTRSDTGAYRSVTDGVKNMLQKEGIRSFWKGTIPGLFLVFQASLQFTFYDHFKQYQLSKKSSTTDTLSTGEYIASSAASKILSTIIAYPSQVIKSRLQNSTTEYKSVISTCKDVWHNEGHWRGFYKGVGTNMLRVVPATCITFVSYETAKDILSHM
jgi:solute carrier family 25 folate transporter 32